MASMNTDDNTPIGALSHDDVIQIVFGTIATVVGVLSVVLAWVAWKSHKARAGRNSFNEGMLLP